MRFYRELTDLPQNVMKKIEELSEEFELLGFKVNKSEDIIVISSEDPLKMRLLESFIKAIEAGYPLEDAFRILKEEAILERIDVDEYAKKKRAHRQRLIGRVIGRKGSCKRRIEEFTNTKILIGKKNIWILGTEKNVFLAREIIMELLSGRTHETAFKRGIRKAKSAKV